MKYTKISATSERQSRKKFLGIYLNPYMVQSEGLSVVFDNLASMETDAIALPLRVGLPVEAGKGKRIPDLHLDGTRRALSRLAWGKKEFYLDLHTVLSEGHQFYEDSFYGPAAKGSSAEVDLGLPRTVANEARRRGMKVYVPIWPTMPPGLRAMDQPELPDGTHAARPHIALTGSPASPMIRQYGTSLMRHVLDEFGDVDGIMVDWNEYGAYDFRDLFGGCEEFARPFADRVGIDFDRVRSQVRSLWDSVHELTTADLRPALGAFARLIENSPGWQDLQTIKAEAVRSFFAELRDVQCKLGHENQELVARGWPPPWNRMTGLWYELLGGICSTVAPKLFAFDYCAVPRWYGQIIKNWNPDLEESRLLEELVHWLGIPDDLEDRSFQDYFIPSVDDPQPAGVPVYSRKIAQVAALVERPLRIQPFAHAHMPDAMWREMVEMLVERDDIEGFWIQMYAYLSDSKIETMRSVRA